MAAGESTLGVLLLICGLLADDVGWRGSSSSNELTC